MKFCDFLSLIQKEKEKHPIWFSLESDKAVADLNIEQVEKVLDVRFPIEYKQFVKNYGGGYFAFAIVYSCDITGAFYIGNYNDKDEIKNKKFISISDDATGDLFGFIVTDEVCSSCVYRYRHEQADYIVEYDDFFDFLKCIGLKNQS